MSNVNAMEKIDRQTDDVEPTRPAYIPKLYITGICTCRNVTSDWYT